MGLKEEPLMEWFALRNLDDTFRPDPFRLFEAIITGVAFLGAGTILRPDDGGSVTGLTTAGSILISAFDFKYKNQYGRTAIVGDKKWEEWGTKISRMFFDSEMKFFYEDQSDDARNWVNA